MSAPRGKHCGRADCPGYRSAGCRHCRCDGKHARCEHEPGLCGTLLTDDNALRRKQNKCVTCAYVTDRSPKKRKAEALKVTEAEERSALLKRAAAAEKYGQDAAQEISNLVAAAAVQAHKDAEQNAARLAAANEEAQQEAEQRAAAERGRKEAEQQTADLERRLASLQAVLHEQRALETAATASRLASMETPKPVNRALVLGHGKNTDKKLGQGGQGSVSLMHMGSGARVAVKSCGAGATRGAIDRLHNELRIMHKCGACPNVVRVYGLLGTPPHREFVMEAADLDLDTRIAKASPARSSPTRADAQPWGEHDRMAIAIGVATGLEHIHSLGVVHNDLKPENVFLFGQVAKLGDFGFAYYRPLGTMEEWPRLDNVGGTILWMPPEHLRAYTLAERAGQRDCENSRSPRLASGRCDRLGAPSDVWAFGCLLECLGSSSRRPSHAATWGGTDYKKGSHFFFQGGGWVPKAPPSGLPWGDVLSATTCLAAQERPTMASVRMALMGQWQLVVSPGRATTWQREGAQVSSRRDMTKRYEKCLASHEA